MERRLFFWELGGFLFTGALGTLLHFVYEWSGGSMLAGAFSAVNESTWEHMKMLFVPIFLCSVVQVCLTGRNYPDLPAVRAVSALTGLAPSSSWRTWGPFPWTSPCSGGGGSPPAGSRSWGWQCCGGWRSASSGAPSARSACPCGKIR